MLQTAVYTSDDFAHLAKALRKNQPFQRILLTDDRGAGIALTGAQIQAIADLSADIIARVLIEADDVDTGLVIVTCARQTWNVAPNGFRVAE